MTIFTDYCSLQASLTKLYLNVLRILRHCRLQPPVSSLFSASVKEMTHASPSMADCLPCRDKHSLDSRSKPSVFTSATKLGWGQGTWGKGQCAADRGHTPEHLKAGVIWTTYRSRTLNLTSEVSETIFIMSRYADLSQAWKDFYGNFQLVDHFYAVYKKIASAII